VATILLAGVGPLFAGELRQLLVGHHLITTESVEEPDLVIADVGRVEPDEISDAYPEVPILGYSNHADPSSLHAAREAGLDRIVERSLLVEKAQALVSELTRPLE
jgi:hypothetical protein